MSVDPDSSQGAHGDLGYIGDRRTGRTSNPWVAIWEREQRDPAATDDTNPRMHDTTLDTEMYR